MDALRNANDPDRKPGLNLLSFVFGWIFAALGLFLIYLIGSGLAGALGAGNPPAIGVVVVVAFILSYQRETQTRSQREFQRLVDKVGAALHR
jgi:hypothetical protein